MISSPKRYIFTSPMAAPPLPSTLHYRRLFLVGCCVSPRGCLMPNAVSSYYCSVNCFLFHIPLPVTISSHPRWPRRLSLLSSITADCYCLVVV